MLRKLSVGQLRVQTVRHGDGREAYAYLLVDHLRWLEHEGLTPEGVGFGDLERYMGAIGAKIAGPYGRPWRVGKRPYGNDALRGAAAVLKGF